MCFLIFHFSSANCSGGWLSFMKTICMHIALSSLILLIHTYYVSFFIFHSFSANCSGGWQLNVTVGEQRSFSYFSSDWSYRYFKPNVDNQLVSYQKSWNRFLADSHKIFGKLPPNANSIHSVKTVFDPPEKPWSHQSTIALSFHEVSLLHFYRNDADVVGVRHGCTFTHEFTFTFMKFHSCPFTFTEMMLMLLVCAMAAPSLDSLSLSWIITVSLSLSWIITVSLSLSQKRCWCRWCAPRLQLHWIHWRQLWWKELLTFSWWHR